MKNNYSGPMEGDTFIAEMPFVLLGWPEHASAKTFDTEAEAYRFIEAAGKSDAFIAFARLYHFRNGKWERLPTTR